MFSISFGGCHMLLSFFVVVFPRRIPAPRPCGIRGIPWGASRCANEGDWLGAEKWVPKRRNPGGDSIHHRYPSGDIYNYIYPIQWSPLGNFMGIELSGNGEEESLFGAIFGLDECYFLGKRTSWTGATKWVSQAHDSPGNLAFTLWLIVPWLVWIAKVYPQIVDVANVAKMATNREICECRILTYNVGSGIGYRWPGDQDILWCIWNKTRWQMMRQFQFQYLNI